MRHTTFLGTLMALLGLLCACGPSIVNGLLALFFLGVATFFFRDAVNSGIEQEEDKDNYAQAA